MRVLIMGGTRFSGRFFTERCIEKGWSVTLFNRGESNPELFGERVERLVGDRNSDAIEQLRDKTFDAVVDMCGQLPSHVERLARLLEPRVHRYLYISSISAYADGDPDNGETPIAHRQTEDAPLTPFDGLGEEDEDDPMMHYAAFKAECERRILDVFGEGERVTILRPGLIVGPHDPTERLTWWIRRAMRGGQIVAPSAPDQPVQCVDARAMADWMIAALEQNHSGTYHAVSPKEALTFDALIETICDLCAPDDASLIRVPGDQLLEHELAPWAQVPLWLGGAPAGLLNLDPARIYGAGFDPPPIEETILATMQWAKETPPPEDSRIGIPEAIEAKLHANITK